MQDSSPGNGAVDAAMKAIDRILNQQGHLVEYNVQAVTQGKDALGEVTIKCDFGGGHLVTGKGASTDVIEASARASKIPNATSMRASGEQSSWAASPRNRFWPVTKPESRSAMMLIAWASRPSSSRRAVSTRILKSPSATCSVARVIWDTERVIPRTSGSQNRIESDTAAKPTFIHGPASKKSPPPLNVLATANKIAGCSPSPGVPFPASRMPIQ